MPSVCLPWCSWEAEQLILNVRIQPRAKKDEIVGLHDNRLKINLSEAPLEGRANERLLRVIADVFRVAKRDVEIISGRSSRNKRIRIRHPRRLPDWLPTS
jgi:uncharacterized protein (TIGR00251 family)